jgi:hypothetical protein
MNPAIDSVQSDTGRLNFDCPAMPDSRGGPSVPTPRVKTGFVIPCVLYNDMLPSVSLLKYRSAAACDDTLARNQGFHEYFNIPCLAILQCSESFDTILTFRPVRP